MANESCTLGETEQLVRLILDQIADKWSILIIEKACGLSVLVHSVALICHPVTFAMNLHGGDPAPSDASTVFPRDV